MIIRNATPKDTTLYALQLAHGINHCHVHGIMHRDIKPGNLIIHTKTKQLKIIDMGLAEFYFPKKEYSVRVASKYYKAPELLLNYPYYAYSLDTWGFGTVLGEMVTGRHPFFYTAKKNDDILEEIVALLGKKDLRTYLKKYDIAPSEMVKQVLDDPDIPEDRQDFIPLSKQRYTSGRRIPSTEALFNESSGKECPPPEIIGWPLNKNHKIKYFPISFLPYGGKKTN
ncbi:serine/threonine protein kinase [Enterocytozoon bieneusi H348]|nr:serine/threonine protein kinase [Enterocytozoon bieneusi H348]|eukprot:XP_002651522.1 serine/threonine protein kinase [Enterocytozoon bieneusi H348]